MTKASVKTAEAPCPQVEIGLVITDGSSRAGIHGLTDLFSYAGDIAAQHRPEGVPPPVRITHWHLEAGDSDVRCIFDSAPGQAHAPDVLLLPGNVQAPEGVDPKGPLLGWLRDKHSQGVPLAAVCGGVFILAGTGLLAGRQATTHWAFRDRLAAQFPDVLTETDQMVIDYGDVITGGGVLAWADLGLRLTERFLGPSVMLDTARFMNVDPPGREQRFYGAFAPPMNHGDAAIVKAQLWLAAQRESPFGVSAVARHVGLEPRTFLRRFVQATGLKPSEYHQRLRVSRARELLEFSRSSVDEIALRVGYNDIGAFRRVFRKVIGLSPSDYRRRFARPATQDR